MDPDWPYVDASTGVLGLGVKSPFYGHFGDLYRVHGESSVFSLHYQGSSLTSDNEKRLRTGSYMREYASTFTVNGVWGSGGRDFRCSVGSGSEFWECEGNSWVKMKGRDPKGDDELSKEVLCFVNTFQELVFVEDSENAKRIILEEICPSPAYGAPVSVNNCKDFDSRLMTPIQLSFTQ